MRAQVGHFEQPDGRSDDHCRQSSLRQILQQHGREHEQQRDRDRANDACQLGPGARRFGDRRARRTAADRKALKEAGRQVGDPQTRHLLVRVDRRTQTRGIGSREHARVRERHEGNRDAAHEYGSQALEGNERQARRRQSLRQRTEHGNAGAGCKIERRHHHGGSHHANQDGGDARQALQQQNQRERAGANREDDDVRVSRRDLLDDSPRLAQGTVGGNRKAEELRNLAQQHRQRDAVHVAVADRLRQQLGNEAQTREAGRHAHDAGDDRHRGTGCDRPLRVARRQRQDDRQNHGRERRVRTQNENAARTEDRVREQRDDGRVEPVDTGHARCLGVRDADRYEHRRHDETGDEVVPQPRRFVLTKNLQPGSPAPPAGRARLQSLTDETGGRRSGGGAPVHLSPLAKDDARAERPEVTHHVGNLLQWPTAGRRAPRRAACRTPAGRCAKWGRTPIRHRSRPTAPWS